MIAQNKRLACIMGIVILLLLTPLIAMQFTDEVRWSVADFVAAAVLLFGTGIACEFVLRRVKQAKKRMIIIGTVITVLLLIWLELAVGIFGTPFAGS